MYFLSFCYILGGIAAFVELLLVFRGVSKPIAMACAEILKQLGKMDIDDLRS